MNDKIRVKWTACKILDMVLGQMNNTGQFVGKQLVEGSLEREIMN